MMQVYIKVEGMEAVLSRLSDSHVKAAAASSINRVGKMMRTEASRAIRDKYNLKKQDLDPNLHVTSHPSSLAVTVSGRYRGGRISLVRFGARQTRSGISVMVKKGRRVTLPHVFMATMPSGHRAVFSRGTKNVRRPVREKNGRRYCTWLPIEEKFSVSVGAILKNPEIRRRLTTVFSENFRKRFLHEYRRRTDRAGVRAYDFE